jgi:hypothetical protein
VLCMPSNLDAMMANDLRVTSPLSNSNQCYFYMDRHRDDEEVDQVPHPQDS